MSDHDLTELTMLYRLRARPSIELFRLSNPVNPTAAIVFDEIVVGVHERGDAEAFYRGVTHGIAAGDVCTYTGGEFVRVQHLMPRSRCTWLVLPREEIRRLTAHRTPSAKPPIFALMAHAKPRVRDALLTLASCVMAEDSVEQQEEALHHFFACLVADCSSAMPPPPSQLMPRAVRIAREYLHGFPDSDVRLADVARAARVSAYHLSHAFGRTMGISVHAYHLLVRIRHARQLLLKGLNAGEAAAEAGFADQSHFTRHFKRIVGVPPGLYARGLKPLRKASYPPAEMLDNLRAGEDG